MSAADSVPGFIQTQLNFASYIRDPDNAPAPTDVELRRMQVYRELFFNNVESFMAASYPVLCEVMGETRWHRFIKNYFSRHQAKTPLFPLMPAELLDYLKHEYQPLDDDPVFIHELAHYEWMELELSNSEAIADLQQINPNGDLLKGMPVISPLAAPLRYHYPVHQISIDAQPQHADDIPTYLLMYRDRQDEVEFTEINALSYRLLQLVSDNETLSGTQILQVICTELPELEPAIIMDGGRQILEQMKLRGILLGTRL
ncbi:MAG: putative DNA-binding domain-containing protein [Proteobacteria bacterium]|nr:putative DNA-binding domain-containing protein [Pseudomonadota bacterium]